MIDIIESFNTAFRLMQEGRLVEAETLYRASLAEASDHPGTHHLLGLVQHQLGRHDEAALASIKRKRSNSTATSRTITTISARSIACSGVSMKRSCVTSTRWR